MRNMKFEMPNDFGIYLHDSPHDELYAQNDRHLSNGCVRLEDYRRFATSRGTKEDGPETSRRLGIAKRGRRKIRMGRRERDATRRCDQACLDG